MSPLFESIAFDAIDMGVIGVTQTRRVLRNCFQNGPNIGRRTGDDAQNFTGGCLLFERLGDLKIARF